MKKVLTLIVLTIFFISLMPVSIAQNMDEDKSLEPTIFIADNNDKPKPLEDQKKKE